jgi:hypothetical protein
MQRQIPIHPVAANPILLAAEVSFLVNALCGSATSDKGPLVIVFVVKSTNAGRRGVNLAATRPSNFSRYYYFTHVLIIARIKRTTAFLNRIIMFGNRRLFERRGQRGPNKAFASTRSACWRFSLGMGPDRRGRREWCRV